MDNPQKVLAHLGNEDIFQPYLSLLSFDHAPSKLPLYEHLVISIISQQLSTKAANTIVDRVYRLFGPEGFSLEALTRTEDDLLRSAGMSRAKVAYVKNVAEYFLNNHPTDCDWSEISDEEVISKLTSIKGVGLWTVQMILIFNLQRPDVFALGDLVVRKQLLELTGLGEDSAKTRELLLEKSRAWAPYRSYVSRLMWSINDSAKKEGL